MAGKSLADLNAEARRDPYVLDIGDGKKVTFTQPTFGTAVKAWADDANVIDVLKKFADAPDRKALEQALNASAPTVPQQVLDEVLEAFGMGNGPGSPSS